MPKQTCLVARTGRSWQPEADAVVIGCRRRTPVGKVVFGSVAQEVIRRGECPIVVAAN